MKRTFIIAFSAVVLASCGASNVQQVTPPDVAAYKAVETTSKSNSDRILKLESDIDGMRKEVESLRIQNRQLADSYDSLVGLFKEHRGLTMTILQKMNELVAVPAESETKK